MKKIIIITVLVFIKTMLFGQVEKEINSKITKVTVFSQNAIIENEATVSLVEGKMILKFKNLSPYIKKESIRVEGDGSFLIQNVKHQNNYTNEIIRNSEIESFTNKIQDLELKIEDEETWIRILKEKISFLQTNKQITGGEQIINPEVFKTLNTMYGANFEAVSLEILKKERLINNYQLQVDKLHHQLTEINLKPSLPSGEIILTIDCKQSKITKISCSYLVENAQWYPSYDIRYVGGDKPILITHKANIKQNTGVDWKDALITLSTATVNQSGQIPELLPNYLNFYVYEAIVDVNQALQGKAAGVQVRSNSGSPGSGMDIVVRGIGTAGVARPLYVVDGNPVGYEYKGSPDNIANLEILKDASSCAIYGARGANGVVLITTKGKNKNSTIPFTVTSQLPMSNEFFIATPQTIESNDKETTISYKESSLQAVYEYQSVPKLSKNVFLISKIPDWYKADLMNGEANIYLENSFVGTSFINTQQFKDTLDVSFGIDNNISIKREKMPEFSEKKTFGSTKKETYAYKITVRNNKSYAISTKILDQIPVPINSEIEVETIELSNGMYHNETGKIDWNLNLKSNETKELIIKYTVKYPSNKEIRQ